MKEFFTRSSANSGRDLKLTLPDGTESDHWLHIVGIDSDIFRRAQSEQHRRTLEVIELKDAGEMSEADAEIEYEKARTALIASLVTGWSFPTECTQENVIDFFREAPQIATSVNLFAGNRKSFFKTGSDDSTNTPKRRESLISLSPDPKARKDRTSKA